MLCYARRDVFIEYWEFHKVQSRDRHSLYKIDLNWDVILSNRTSDRYLIKKKKKKLWDLVQD